MADQRNRLHAEWDDDGKLTVEFKSRSEGSGMDVIARDEYKIDICGECGERVLGAAYSCSNLHLGPNRVIEVVPKQHASGAVEALRRAREDLELAARTARNRGDDNQARVYDEGLAQVRAALGGQSSPAETFEQSSGGETIEEAQARMLRGEHAFGPHPGTRSGEQT